TTASVATGIHPGGGHRLVLRTPLTPAHASVTSSRCTNLVCVCGRRRSRLWHRSSWLKALNLVRNTGAHRGRLFNCVHTIALKLPRVGLHPCLAAAATEWNRTFARLTLVQFLSDRLRVG